MFIFTKLKSSCFVPKWHHQGRLIGHEKRVDYAQLRHIQVKSPSHHHTGHSELTKTFDGMGPHSGDTVSDPSNRGMGLKIQGQLMLACVQPGRPSTLRKKESTIFLGKVLSLHMLPWCLPIFIQVRAILFSHFTSTDCI